MKYLQNILIACLICSYSSCSRLEDNVFDATPAERINNAIQNTTDALTSSTSGWLMEYYATPDSSGYPLLLKFLKSSETIIAAQNEFTLNKAYQADSSIFKVIGDAGPVLTFNTYNDVLHTFSNPINPDGVGQNGDYEFIVKSVSVDSIWLQGKKNGSSILLSQLASGTNWKSYIATNSTLDSILFSGNSPKLTLKTATSTYYLSLTSTHIFKATKSTTASSSFSIPFIVTQTGIKFYSTVTLDGLTFRSFNLNADKSALVSSENNTYKITGIDDLSSYFLSNVINWKLNRSAMSSSMQTIYDQLAQYLQNTENAQNIALTIKYSSSRRSYVLSLTYNTNSGAWERNLDIGISSGSKNNLALSYKSTGDAEALNLYNNSQAMKDLMAALTNSFSLTSPANINPQTITLTKSSSLWFSIYQ